MLASAEPDILEAYQSVHNSNATATLRDRSYMASFVRIERGTLALFGVFRRVSVDDVPRAEIVANPHVARLIGEFDALQELVSKPGENWPWITFERTEHLVEYVGRLQIRPRLTPNYVRRAENLDAEIVALSEASDLTGVAPEWRETVLSGPEIRTLPGNWAVRLREWRGIYLIIDETDGQKYVGSAYGQNNLLGRWRDHVAGEQGVTKNLMTRDPINFRFSILERVSPDLPQEDVVQLERTWMKRLDTINNGLNH